MKFTGFLFCLFGMVLRMGALPSHSLCAGDLFPTSGDAMEPPHRCLLHYTRWATLCYCLVSAENCGDSNVDDELW